MVQALSSTTRPPGSLALLGEFVPWSGGLAEAVDLPGGGGWGAEHLWPSGMVFMGLFHQLAPSSRSAAHWSSSCLLPSRWCWNLSTPTPIHKSWPFPGAGAAILITVGEVCM